MSQILSQSISSSPTVPTQVTTDNGIAVPVGNNLNIVGDNGIVTEGSGDTVTIKFNEGNATTVDAATTTVMTLTPPANSAQTYQILIDGYDTANNIAIGGQIIGTVRSDGVTAVVIGTPDKIKNSDASIATGDYTLVASGANILVQATGVLGHNIAWDAITAGQT